MPSCPLDVPGCRISSATRPRCPMSFRNCPFSLNRFASSELRQEAENWSDNSLQTVLERFDRDEEITMMVRQLKSEIDSGFLDQQ